ncbi:MAG: YfhO family protein, partial [Bacteroidia bacterium]
GLALLYYLAPTLFFDFFSVAERTQMKDAKGDISASVDNIEAARVALFRSSAIRSFFFITLAAGAIWLYLKSTINRTMLIAALAVLVLFDLTLIDKNFLNEKNFTSKKESRDPFPATTADNSILDDKDPDYRVLNISVQTFQDASTSYYHKSIGGYSAAKLRRYQELIDAHIQNEIQNIVSTLKSNPTDSAMRTTFAQQNVLNMLNTRYIIYNPDAPALKNRYALGDAWFVSNVKMVPNADEEIKTVEEINPRTTLVVDERYKPELDGFTAKQDPSATIKLTDYAANDLKYESNAASEQLAVFSEIYYKDGWNAYVDGQLKPHFSCDWVLRAMRVPAGKHNIEFKFEPTKYYTGEKISLVSCLLLFGFIGTSAFLSLKKKEG